MNALGIASVLLVAGWGASTWFVLSTGRGIGPMHGWMVGLSFFIVLPFVIIGLNGGYTVPAYYGIKGDWGTLDLSDRRFLLPMCWCGSTSRSWR